LRVLFFLLTVEILGVDGQVLEYTFSHLQDGLEHEGVERDHLIRSYFHQGLSYNEIVFTLFRIHGISLCVRQLKRILARLGLKRRFSLNNCSPLEEIVEKILKEIENSGQCIGYRTMWRRLVRCYNLNVKRDTVLNLLRVIDPDGIERRKRRRLLWRRYSTPGPNCLWHVDGYDKLKPYGFAIHAAIDGYSRRILWIEVS
jgi:hypothetical protein